LSPLLFPLTLDLGVPWSSPDRHRPTFNDGDELSNSTTINIGSDFE
jgi:hypothetical protein